MKNLPVLMMYEKLSTKNSSKTNKARTEEYFLNSSSLKKDSFV